MSVDEPDPRRWRALAVTLLVGFMALIDVTIVNVAVPSIQRGLDASPQGIQWVISGYALTFGLTLVAGGRLGDLVGRRRMFLIGLALFTLTSASAGAAPSEDLLVAARLLQGMAAGLLMPQNTGLIQMLFSGAERGRAFGIFGTTVSISAATGPILGGAIIALFGAEDGWRYVFWVNVPIGVAGMVLAARVIPRRELVEPGRSRTARLRDLRRELDLVGTLLLTSSVFLLLLPLVQSTQNPATRWWLLVLLVPPAAWAFLQWERRVLARGDSPVLDVTLLSGSFGYTSGILLGTVYFTAFAGIWLVLALFLQDGLGYSALQSGLAVTSFAVGSAASSILAGRLVARYDRWVTLTGLVLVIAGFVTVAVLVPTTLSETSTPDNTGLWVAIPLLVAGVGGGAVISPNFTLTLAHVPPRMGGAAGGALQTGQRIGSAMGAALLAVIYRGTLARTSGDLGNALATTFLVSSGLLLVALVIAVAELRNRRTSARGAVLD